MLKNHSINELNNFIGGWFISKDLCDEIVKQVKSKSYKLREVEKFDNFERNYFYTNFVDLESDFLANEYFNYLQKILLEYRQEYKESDRVERYCLGNDYKIQYYKPNNCYSSIHCENDGIYETSIWRHLVFMTYLNDIDYGGETEFINQNIKVRPEKGLTLIWPSQWTHAHRGHSTQSEKYILTGWYYFVNQMTNKITSW